jgi:hypothetical protein
MPSERYVTTTTGLSSTFGWPIYVPDCMVRPFNIGIGCVVSSTGTQTYNVEHSFDYTGSSTFISSNATWFANSALNAQSSNANGNYASPVSVIRLNVTNGSSLGAVTMTIMQAG